MSVWASPRETIEQVTAQPNVRPVLLLAALGGAASTLGIVMSLGVTGGLFGWLLLVCLVGGGIFGIVHLYIFAAVTAWFGRKFGGRASAADMRAAFAYGFLPGILGAALTLLLLAGLAAIDGPHAVPPVWLTIGRGVFGLWAIVLTMLMVSRIERFGFWRTVFTYGIGALLIPALVAIVFRTLFFQPFNIPASSMVPTLLVGDYIFTNKYAYGYSRYSLPFSPPFFGRIFGSQPRRGDVIVFRVPRGTEADYVKRVVGLPGDRVQMKEGELQINGMPVRRERLSDATLDACGTESATVKRWRETIGDGVSYETLDCMDNGFYDNTPVYTVPTGHVFVLGDNRDNSTDSRAVGPMGYIPLENIIGRVGLIFFSRDGGAIRWGRIGTIVR
jgi:signal peptidase I